MTSTSSASKPRKSLASRLEASGYPTRQFSTASFYFKDLHKKYAKLTAAEINADPDAKKLFLECKADFKVMTEKFTKDVDEWKEKNPELAQENAEHILQRSQKRRESAKLKAEKTKSGNKQPSSEDDNSDNDDGSDSPEKPSHKKNSKGTVLPSNKKKVRISDPSEGAFEKMIEEESEGNDAIVDIKYAFSVYKKDQEHLQEEFNAIQNKVKELHETVDVLVETMKSLHKKQHQSNDLQKEVKRTLDGIAYRMMEEKKQRAGMIVTESGESEDEL